MEAEWIQAVAFVIYDLLLIAAIVYAVAQVREVRAGRHGQAFLAVMQQLQNEELRADRGHVFGLPADRSVWTEDDVQAAERVAHNYDLLGLSARFGMVPPDWLLRGYRDSLTKAWAKLKGMVKEYQQQRGREFWSNFEMIGEAATGFESAIDWKRLDDEVAKDWAVRGKALKN